MRRTRGTASSGAVMMTSWPGFNPRPTRTATSARRSRSWAWDAASDGLRNCSFMMASLERQRLGQATRLSLRRNLRNRHSHIPCPHGARALPVESDAFDDRLDGQADRKAKPLHGFPGQAGDDGIAAAIERHI